MSLIKTFFNSVGETLDEDARILIREAELHALVRLHKLITTIKDEIEDEFEYRVQYEEKLAAGTDEEREYARDVIEN